MSTDLARIAEAFSAHRFEETYAHLASHVRWVAVGQTTLEGSDAVIAACTATAAELSETDTEFTRFVVVAGSDAVAVDAIGRYTDAEGVVSVVSSCDIYQFDNDQLTMITSYAAELAPS